jgi:spore germination cell wall hydrolase CwlJ-like protein
MYYHTTAVSPDWSRSFKRVAAIGSHIFYSPR